MYYSITFVNEAGVRKNTWDDWHIVPSSRPVIEPPEPKTSYVDIPGGNGSIDFTTALVPHPLFKDREGTLEFIVLNSYNIWHELYSDIMTFLNGQKVKLYLEETPDYYYEGRITIDEWNSKDHPRSKIKMKYKVSPFQIGNDKVTKTLTVDGDAIMTISASELDTAPVTPSFSVQSTGGGSTAPFYSVTTTDFNVNGLNSNFIGGVYGDGKTVLIRSGNTDNICVLQNGDWSTYSVGDINTNSSIFYLGGVFIILAGGNVVISSANGEIWTTSELLNFNNPTSVANNGNRLYVMTNVTSSNAVTISTDGVNWGRRSASGYQNIIYLTYAFSKFIGVHFDYDGTNPIFTLYSSTDGETWAQLTGIGLENDQLSLMPLFHRSVICNNVLYVPLMDETMSTPASLLCTSDGVAWSIRQISSDTTSGILMGLTKCGDNYVAYNMGCTTENLYISRDCINWTAKYEDNAVITQLISDGNTNTIVNYMEDNQTPRYLDIVYNQPVSPELRVSYQDDSFSHVIPEYDVEYPDITLFGKDSYQLKFTGKGTVNVEIEKRRL